MELCPWRLPECAILCLDIKNCIALGCVQAVSCARECGMAVLVLTKIVVMVWRRRDFCVLLTIVKLEMGSLG